ncbi:MAG: CDP-alcohol phosphatidyltransferase [Cryptosporangiaceae bacterium]|nr:CDP-alcohol phosphatidyltransferase [Cryptosporangiaceae bacterium]
MPASPGPEGAVGTGRAGQGLVDRRADGGEVRSDLIFTIPNLLSFLRLLGVPLFLYLVLGPRADLAAVAVLMLSGVSDYLDGRLARAWGQVSRIGQLLDPLADRLYILATVGAFVARDVIPWWLGALLIGRDLLLALLLPLLRHHGYGPLPVHFLGKAATANLLYAFPLLLLGAHGGALGDLVRPFAWAFTIWGVCLYYWAGALYVVQAVRIIRIARRGTPR